MPVADSLSPAAEALWQELAQPDERVLLTAASDVRAGGSFGERWIVVTDRRVVVLPETLNGHQVEQSEVRSPKSEVTEQRLRTSDFGLGDFVSVPLSALTEAKTEPLVGGGRLEVYDGLAPLPLLEYSSSLGPKFAEIARG